MAESGFSATPIEAVARRAGVATGTVYRYFPSRADLFCEVFREASSREVALMAEAAAIPGPPQRRLRDAIELWATRAISGRRLAYALIAEPVLPEIEVERLVYRRAYADVLRKLLARGAHHGDFVIIDLDVAATGLVGAMAEALVGPLAPDDRSLAERGPHVITALIDLCLRAVGCPPTPRKP